MCHCCWAKCSGRRINKCLVPCATAAGPSVPAGVLTNASSVVTKVRASARSCIQQVCARSMSHKSLLRIYDTNCAREMQYHRVWSKWRKENWEKNNSMAISLPPSSPHVRFACSYMNNCTAKRHLQLIECILVFRKVRCRHSCATVYLKISFWADKFCMADLSWRCGERLECWPVSCLRIVCCWYRLDWPTQTHEDGTSLLLSWRPSCSPGPAFKSGRIYSLYWRSPSVKITGIVHENMWDPLTYSSELSFTDPYEVWLCIRKPVWE